MKVKMLEFVQSIHSLARVMSAFSIEEGSMVCSICKKSYKDLKRHSLIHFSEKPYKRETCSKTFNNHGSLFHHIKRHKTRQHPLRFMRQGIQQPDIVQGP